MEQLVNEKPTFPLPKTVSWSGATEAKKHESTKTPFRELIPFEIPEINQSVLEGGSGGGGQKKMMMKTK